MTTSEGSRKSRFTVLGAEPRVWQNAKTLDYQDIPIFRNAVRWDASAYKM